MKEVNSKKAKTYHHHSQKPWPRPPVPAIPLLPLLTLLPTPSPLLSFPSCLPSPPHFLSITPCHSRTLTWVPTLSTSTSGAGQACTAVAPSPRA
jgi:hypothetical protein